MFVITPSQVELIMSMAKDQPTTSSASRARQHLEVADNIHRPRAMYPRGSMFSKLIDRSRFYYVIGNGPNYCRNTFDAAVSQARRATLVRFLEKRKDR